VVVSAFSQSSCHCLSQYPCGQNAQHAAGQVRNTLAEQRPDGSGSKSSSKRAYIRLPDSHRGVPRGSSSGPVLFKVLTNHLDTAVKCTGPLLPSPSGLVQKRWHLSTLQGQGQATRKKGSHHTRQSTSPLETAGRPCAGRLGLLFPTARWLGAFPPLSPS